MKNAPDIPFMTHQERYRNLICDRQAPCIAETSSLCRRTKYIIQQRKNKKLLRLVAELVLQNLRQGSWRHGLRPEMDQHGIGEASSASPDNSSRRWPYGILELRVGIASALAASAHWDVGGWQAHLRCCGLSDLCPCVHNAADEADENGRYTAECNRRIEEDETADGDWELVKSADHGVGCRRGNANTPSGGI